MQPNSFSTTTCSYQKDIYHDGAPGIVFDYTSELVYRTDGLMIAKEIGGSGFTNAAESKIGSIPTRTVCVTQSVVPEGGGGGTAAFGALESMAFVMIWFVVAISVASITYLFSR